MSVPSTTNFEGHFAQAWPPRDWCDSHVVLAVSAGPDSVAMLRAAAAIKADCGGTGRLHVEHLNHSLRGAEADADAEWLEQLCGRLNLPIEIGKTDVPAVAAQQGDGIEAAARSARYEFLTRTAERLGARFVAAAHTADDQIETVLHRIVRGTGLAGLAGIPGVRPLSPSVTLVRPLLGVWRREVLEYLSAIGQDFRTDASNLDPSWTRNRLRLELLPVLREKYNADVDSALLRLAAQARESQQVVSKLAAEIAEECVTIEQAWNSAAGTKMATKVLIDCRQLAGAASLIVREVCRSAWTQAGWPQQAMGFDQWRQLAGLVREDGKFHAINLPGDVRARREGHVLVLEAPGLP